MPHRRSPAQAQRRVGGHHHRPGDHPQKEVIERAYRTAEGLGLPVWCEDEAGPYQAIPQPGESWQPEGHPARQPHEYIRGGTAKLFTLFRPATGEVRGLPVERSTNAILHPWLEQELAAILQTTPVTVADSEARPGCGWADWDWHLESEPVAAERTPLRLLLILDLFRCRDYADSGAARARNVAFKSE